MRLRIIIILCCLWGNPLLAQKIPFAKMQEHLLLSGEIFKGASDTSDIFCSQIAGNDSVAIFQFGSRSTHSYFFLLLKNINKCKILNCYDLDADWNDLREVFFALGSDFRCQDVFAVFDLYKINAGIQKAPPKPVFKNGKFTGTTEKTTRNIIPTSSFLCEF